jgi:hypothetical protein
MSAMKDALRSLVTGNEEIYSIIGKVTSVDGSFCDVSPIDGSADLLGVRLQVTTVNGFLLIPKVNTNVIVSFLSKDEAFVSMVSEVDEIRLNGNSWSLLKTEVFLEQMDKLKQSVDALMDGFTNWTPVAQDGGAALKTAMTTSLAGKETGDFTNVKNETVKHGQG